MKKSMKLLSSLQDELNKTVLCYDYWFNEMHEFWLKNQIPVYIPAEGDEYSQTFCHFEWKDYPKQKKLYFSNMDVCSKKADELRQKIKIERNKFTLEELSFFETGWEDKYYGDLETFIN